MSMRHRIMLPYSKVYRLAALWACGTWRAAASRCCFGPPNPHSTEGYACGAVRWRSARRTCARGVANGYGNIVRLKDCWVAGGGCRPRIPAFRCARLALQAVRYRGKRTTWQVPHTPAFRCARLLSCRRLATAGNKALERLGLPPPHSAFRCARHVFQMARYRGQRSARQVGLPPPHPHFPLRSAFVLQAARYRGQRSAWHPARALAHSHRGHGAAHFFWVGARM